MIEKWRKIYYPRDQCSRQMDGPMTEASKIKDTQGAFILLFIGVVGGSIVLILEGIIAMCRRYKRRKKRIRPKRTEVIQELVLKSMWT